MQSNRVFAALVLGLLAMAAAPVPETVLTVKDLSPKFLAFYRKARDSGATGDQLFQLWKKDYGFAAVPPTPEGDAMARTILEAAWPRYPSVMARIEKGAAGMAPSPEETLKRVAAELRPDKPVRVTLLAYVGGLETNAFTMGGKGTATVAVPIEMDPKLRGPIMAHEMTHAVQITMGTNSGGWIRTVAETTLAEGLAMRTAHRLYPEVPEAEIVSGRPGWLAEADARSRAILADLKPVLASDKSADVFRYTIGKGGAGIEREAYYAGWRVTGFWLAHGMTLADIARIPEAEAPARVAAAIDAILAEAR